MRGIVSLALLSLVGCSTVTPGVSAVVVDVCGVKEDVERYSVVKGGKVWIGTCRDVYWIPTREQREVWSKVPEEGETADESITFAGLDGQPVNIDLSIGYQIPPEDASIINMVRTFGGDVDLTIGTKVRDSVRNALNMCAGSLQMSVQDIYGAGKESLFLCVEKKVQQEYNPHGLIITRVALNSEIRLADNIKEAMQRAQEATQNADRARREVDQTRAEGEKKIAEAEAESSGHLDPR